ncbi:MAG: hypothetical protein RLZZ237_2282 [Pseudomonadota bacterium]|jgi:threonine/homoserine/homoserine lactone efflux protein
MQLSNWLLFCSVSLLVTFSPGPAVLLAISNSIAVGPRRAMISSMGNGTGLFIISGIAMAGMGVVLATSATAFMLLKLAGALYLVYLGIKQWRSKTSIVANAPQQPGAANPNSNGKLYRQGMMVALTNPKAILFFSALFPQFIVQGQPVAMQFTVLTTTFVACAMSAHLFYALLARLLKSQLADPARARLFNRISGGAFVLLGLSLLRLRAKAT